MHPNIYISIIYSSHYMEATYVPIARWIGEDNVVCMQWNTTQT